MSRKLLISLSVLLIILAGGCTLGMSGEEITQEEAEMIALEDAPDFQPDSSEFEVYQTEPSDQGWEIMISSIEAGHENQEPSPIIYYEVSKTGNIMERENMALAE